MPLPSQTILTLDMCPVMFAHAFLHMYVLVCGYVCMYLYMYECTYVKRYIYIYLYLCMWGGGDCPHVYLFIYVNMLSLYVCVYVLKCVHQGFTVSLCCGICVDIYIYIVCKYICICTYVYTYMCMLVYIQIWLQVCACTCKCMDVQVCIGFELCNSSTTPVYCFTSLHYTPAVLSRFTMLN